MVPSFVCEATQHPLSYCSSWTHTHPWELLAAPSQGQG